MIIDKKGNERADLWKAMEECRRKLWWGGAAICKQYLLPCEMCARNGLCSAINSVQKGEANERI